MHIKKGVIENRRWIYAERQTSRQSEEEEWGKWSERREEERNYSYGRKMNLEWIKGGIFFDNVSTVNFMCVSKKDDKSMVLEMETEKRMKEQS